MTTTWLAKHRKTVAMWAYLGRNLTNHMMLEKPQLCVMILSTGMWMIVFLCLQKMSLSTGESQLCVFSEAGTVCSSLPPSTWVPRKEEKEVYSSILFFRFSPLPLPTPLLERGAGNLQFSHGSNPLSDHWKIIVCESLGTFFWQGESKKDPFFLSQMLLLFSR